MRSSDGYDAVIDAHGTSISKLAAEARRIIEHAVPELTSKANPGWRAITYHHPDAGYVLGLFPFADRVDLAFERGATLVDPDRLFEPGDHLKRVRYVRLRPGKRVRRSSLERLLHAAVHHGALRRAGRR